MTTKRLSIIIGGAVLLPVALATAGVLFLSHANDLGLTGFDAVISKGAVQNVTNYLP